MTRAVLVAALAVAPLVVQAQEPVDTARLGPIVVTADRLPIAATAVPAAVTVLSGAALRAQGIRTVADALRTVPGATVVASGSFGAQTSLFVRGGESDYVKVLIDGVPQNQPGGAFDLAARRALRRPCGRARSGRRKPRPASTVAAPRSATHSTFPGSVRTGSIRSTTATATWW